MANVGFKLGTQAALNDLIANGGAIEGVFYLTSNTNRLYIGKSDGTIASVNEGVITVANVNALPNSEATGRIPGAFYYATLENVLCVWNGQVWVQINSVVTNTKVEHSTSAITDGTALSTSISDSRNGDPVIGTFNIVGADGITVTGSGATITVAGDPITVATSAASNTATTTIKSKSGETDGKFAIAGGSNVTVTASGDTITIAADDVYVEKVNVINKAEGFGLVPVDNNDGDHTETLLNPVISLNGADKTTVGTDIKFANGTATLPVYTAAEVDAIKSGLEAKLDTELKAFNAMEYKGTVGTEGTLKALPVVGDLIKNGYAYLVAGELTVGAHTYPAGTLIVATGTEDASTGYLTDIEWSYVTGSTSDTTYAGEVQADGTLMLTPSTGGDAVASINVTQGNDIVVTPSASSGKSQVYNVAHKTYEGTAYDTTAATDAGAMGSLDAAYVIEAITGITVSNGHITGVTSKKYTVKDTNVTLDSTTATVTSVENSNIATVSHKTILLDANNGDITADAAEFTVESASLEVKANTAKTGMSINLVWGTF